VRRVQLSALQCRGSGRNCHVPARSQLVEFKTIVQIGAAA